MKLQSPSRPGRPQGRLHADSFSCGLRERTLGGLVDLGPESAWLLFVAAGDVLVTGPTDAALLRGPAIGWFPDAPAHRLRARAGSAGRTVILSDLALAAATRRDAAAAAIREMTQRRVVLSLADTPQLRADVDHALAMILRETAGKQPGADSVIDAQIATLMLLFWRRAGALPAGNAVAPDPILADFRRLVELHFRDRWSVADYARRLGVSPDLLHDRCTRRLGRTPLRLIRERVVHEARMLLEQTPLSVADIAAELGFGHPSHFSRVFTAASGIPPGRFRQRSRTAVRERDSGRGFADWP